MLVRVWPWWMVVLYIIPQSEVFDGKSLVVRWCVFRLVGGCGVSGSEVPSINEYDVFYIICRIGSQLQWLPEFSRRRT